MEEKDKLILEETERVRERKSVAVAVAEAEEKKEEQAVDKTKVNLQKLRAELEKEKQQKRAMFKKEQAVVETPNYDFIKEISPEKRKKIYKIEKTVAETSAKPFTFNKKLKAILFGLVFFIAGAFCLSSGIQLIDASNALSASQAQYELNLYNLIKKISKTDSGNKMLELIETYPDVFDDPSSIAEDSNWFDKICNFISGIFGG